MDIFEKLLQIEEESTTIDELTKGFYSLIECPIAIIDENYKIISHFALDKYTLGKTFYDSINRGYWSIELINKISKSLANNDFAIFGFDNINRLFIKLKDKDNNLLGYLVIIEFNKKLKDIDKELLTHISKIITKYLLINNTHQNINNLNSFFTSLINKEFNNETIFLEKYNSIIDKSKIYKFIIISINNIDKKVLKTLEISLTFLFMDSTIIFKEEYIIIFLYNEINYEDINSFFFKNKLYGILSTPILDFYNINTVYNILKKLLTYLIVDKNEYILYKESDYIFLSTIIGTNDNIVLLSLIHENILKLYKYDIDNNTSLGFTLYTYIKCNRSLAECSKELYVHKNTITYRLNKIKDILDDNLDSSSINLNYLHSLLIIKYLISIKFDFNKYLK
ncbi:MAG: helix-turn-helix domain-containing protein [Mollicutes bacterium]|nr:helix-turn-helix domain-containing protein [Mollicutes bacterium]MDD7263759.1 helix-turn-helix domain-containing protein [bacterium]MDY4979785.1 helix-turn-helix domain-containing protein [Candidatus Onthovivens sp.]